MSNFFTRLIEDGANNVLNVAPSVSTGYAVDTASVLKIDYESNPYFLSINNISGAEANILLKDAAKSGVSLALKSPSVSKHEFVQINPVMVDGMYGGNTGKNGDLTNMGNLHVVHTGNNFNSATVVGFKTRPANVTPSQHSDATVANNTGTVDKTNAPNQPKATNPAAFDRVKDKPVLVGPFRPEDPMYKEWEAKTISKDAHMLPDIDKKTGKRVKTSENGKSAIGDNIRTGTHYVGITEIIHRFLVDSDLNNLFNFGL